VETGSGHQNLLHLALLSIIIRLQILHRFADCRSKVHLIGVIVDYYYTSARMNRLTRHKYHECSDLPALRPIFSCTACDEWTQRIHSFHFKDRSILDRFKLSARYQCEDKKKNLGSIPIQVVCSHIDSVSSSESEAEPVYDAVITERPNASVAVDEKAVVNQAKALAAKQKRSKRLENKLKRKAAEYFSEKENTEALANRNASLENTKAKLQVEVDVLKQRLKVAQEQKKHYKSQVNQGRLDITDRKGLKKLCKVIENTVALALPGRHAGTKAKFVLDAISSGMLFSGEGVKLLHELHRQYVRHIFKEWKLVKAYDCSSIGAFKTATIKALHSVLDESKIGLFPSPSSNDRARAKLDEHCQNISGCERKMTKYGEVYFINFDNAIHLLLKATGLYDKAQRTNVSLAFTADGAALTKSRTHVSCGVKVTDPDGKHPITGLPLMCIDVDEDCDDDDGGKTIYNFMQSRELCTILVIADAHDSKELYYDVFKDFFKCVEKLGEHGMDASNGEPKLQPFIISYPQDMKSAQITATQNS
jgi:hypothetical protein